MTGRPFLPPIYGLECGDSDCYNRGHYGVDPDTSNDWKNRPDKQTTLDAVKVAQRFKSEDMPAGWMLVNDDYGCGYSDDLGYELVDGTYWGKREIEALKHTGDELRNHDIQIGLRTQSALDRRLPRATSTPAAARRSPPRSGWTTRSRSTSPAARRCRCRSPTAATA